MENVIHILAYIFSLSKREKVRKKDIKWGNLRGTMPVGGENPHCIQTIFYISSFFDIQ